MRPPPPRLRPHRVFFPLAVLAGAVAVAGIAATRSGALPLPAVGDAVLHAHEMLYGHFAAAFAGVVLTALPRWTGRPAPSPAALVALAALWAAARASAWATPWLGEAAATATFALAAAQTAATVVVVGRPILAAGDRRDAIVPLLLAVFAVADGLAAIGAIEPATGLRFAFAAALGLATLMGGRVAPALTRHWAESRGRPLGPLVSPPVEIAVTIASAAALAAWAIAPESRATAGLAVAAAIAGAVRLARWRGLATLGHPSLFALHVGYAFLPLGFLLWAGGVAAGDVRLLDAARHAFGAGVLGVMCVAVQTSVVRRHEGRPLTRDRFGDVAAGLLLVAALVRLAVPFLDDPLPATEIAAAAWLGGQAGLVAALVHAAFAGQSGRASSAASGSTSSR